MQGPGQDTAGLFQPALESFVDSFFLFFLIQERTSREREQTKSDEDCGVGEEAGRLGRACGAEPARKEAKRTVLDAGLAWESQKKHVRPSS